MSELKQFFIHWGPGGHSLPERTLLPPSTVNINQWIDLEPSGCLTNLVRQAAEKIKNELNQNQPLRLIGHSFGARVALEAWFELKKIGFIDQCELTLLAHDFNLVRSYAHLAIKLSEIKSDSQLQDIAALFSKSPTSEHFVHLVGEITKYPDFMSIYFSKQSATIMQSFFDLAAKTSLLDFNELMQVMNHYFDQKLSLSENIFHEITNSQTRVQIILGRNDPFTSEETGQDWKAHLPQASLKWVETGHFPHLELGTLTF